MQTSIDGSGVSWPMASASTWSTVLPPCTVPFSGCAPLRNTAADRAWSAPASDPLPPASGWARLLTTTMRSRSFSSGFNVSVKAKPLPSVAGVHLSMVAPCGM